MLPKIGVVILNWNQWESTFKCITSIKDSKYPIDRLKIIVVDNGSDNESIYQLKQIPDTKLLELPTNQGFSAGNNIGIRFALHKRCNYILIQNNDTVVRPFFFEALLEAFNMHHSAGIVVPKIVYKDHPDVIWYAGGRFRKPRIIGELIGNKMKDREMYNNQSVTDFAVGCSMMVESTVFNKVGLFDEDFFLYHEDVDFSLRVREHSYSIQYQPTAIVEHEEFGSTKQLEGIRIYYEAQSRSIFFKKHIPLSSLLPVIFLEFLRTGRKILRYSLSGKFRFGSLYMSGLISGIIPELGGN